MFQFCLHEGLIESVGDTILCLLYQPESVLEFVAAAAVGDEVVLGHDCLVTHMPLFVDHRLHNAGPVYDIGVAAVVVTEAPLGPGIRD